MFAVRVAILFKIAKIACNKVVSNTLQIYVVKKKTKTKKQEKEALQLAVVKFAKKIITYLCKTMHDIT